MQAGHGSIRNLKAKHDRAVSVTLTSGSRGNFSATVSRSQEQTGTAREESIKDILQFYIFPARSLPPEID